MAEYQGSNIPEWLRQAASSFEEAAHGDVPEGFRRSRESGSLRELVDYAADRLALLRLQNLRESLADVEQILQGLKHEQEIRRREGRATKLTEQLILQAEQERSRLLQQMASAVDIPGIYSERRRSQESYERYSSTEQAITRNFSRFYRSQEEPDSLPPAPRYYRDRDFEDDVPYYYSRSREAAERPSRSQETRSVRPAAPPQGSTSERSRTESASWLSVRVERKNRSGSAPAPLSLSKQPSSKQQSPGSSREGPRPATFSLGKPRTSIESTRRLPSAPSSRLAWLSTRTQPVEVTAEDLPAVDSDDELLLADEELANLDALLVEEDDFADLDLGELEDLNLDDLDLEADLDDLGLDSELADLEDFDIDLVEPELLDEDMAELVDDELSEPFLDPLDDELEEDLGFELEAEADVDLEDLEDLSEEDAEVEADPTQLDVDLEGFELDADPLDDLDLSDLDLEDDEIGELDFDLEDLSDLEDIDLDDLGLEELAEPEETDFVIEEEADAAEFEPVAIEEEVIALEPPPAEVEPVAVEEEAIALEPPPAEVEPVAIEEEAIALEPPPAEVEPVAVEEEAIALEPPPAEVEPVAVEEEAIALEAPPAEVEPVAVEEEAIALEAPPAEVEPVAVEEEVIAAEPPAAEVEPVTVEEEVIAAEPPAAEVEPVAVEEEVIAAEPPPVEVEPVAVEEEVIAAEPPAAEVEPVAAEEEVIAAEPPPVEVEPVAVEEEVIAAEPPAAEVEPVAVEEEVIAAEPPPAEVEPVAVEEEVIAAEPSPETETVSFIDELPMGEELSLIEVDPAEATGFFEDSPLEAAPSFLEGDELFASGELPALETSSEASLDGDLLTGSVEALEPSGDFFTESFEGDNSWLDAPVADSVDAPEWLKSPDEELPAITDAPPFESLEKVPAQEEAPASLEAAIQEATVPGEVASPPPAALEAPPRDTGASAQERRKLVRLSCSYDLTAYVEGRPVPCKLMDISLGGGKLVGPDGFQRGQLIQVSNPLPEAKSSDPVTARIVWMRANREQPGKFDLGLQFEESPEVLGKSWVITVLNKIGMQSKVFNQRKYTRAVANLPIEVVLITAERLPGTAIDLGLGGALLAVDRPMTPTTKLTLHMGPLGNHDKLELRCEVISSRHDEGGRGWTHSAKFNEISTTQTKLLGKYVVDLLKTGGSV